MAQILDPELMDEAQREEAQQRYVEAVQRGESGSRLARSAGIAAPVGSSPPMFNPPPINLPPMRLDSAANYVRYAPGDEEDSFWQGFEQRMASAPIAQTQKAIQAALQYQSMRGFQRDVASGIDPAQAAMKWAPGMNRSTLAGVAALTRATNRPEQPQYEFTPGDVTTGRPAAWMPKGGAGRPLNVPRSSITLPPEETGPVKREEVVPGSGVYIATQPGVKGFKIITAKTPGLTPDQKFKLEKDTRKELVTYQERLRFMDEADPTYQSTKDLIDVLQGKISELKGQVAPPPALNPAPAAAPVVPQAERPQPSPPPFKEGQRIRSKSDPSKIYVIRNGKPVLLEE